MSSNCEKYSAELTAYLDGALQDGPAEEIRRHLTMCAACREELAWLENAYATLKRIGNDVARDLPPIDVRAGVMAAIANASAQPRVLPFAPPRRPESAVRFWLGFATAAALLLGVWSSYEYLRSHPSSVHVAVAPHPDQSAPPASTKESAIAKASKQHFDKERQQLGPMRSPKTPGADVPFEQTPPPQMALGATPEEVIQARRLAESTPEALERLHQWARLHVDDARRLVQSGDAALADAVAASESLPLDEAIAVLEQTVARYPDDLTARFALAKAYGERGGAETQALTMWSSIAQKDPQNSTAYMEMASLYFQQGDTQSALAMLQHAATLPRADVYTSANAQYRESALIASGVAPDTAALLAAFTAGSGEYDYLLSLGTNLLSQGRYYEESGDMITAATLYESVREFGEQVAESADYSMTELAGLDLQRAATDLLEPVYASTGDQQDMEALATQTVQLAQNIDQLSVFFSSLNDLFGSSLDMVVWSVIADLIITEGDLSLFDLIKEFIP